MIENDSMLFKVNVDNYNGPLDVLLDLAKAQKVFLLIKSAEHALDQISAGSGPIQTGDLVDAHTKYTKAKEICDNSCGCDC